MPATREKVTLGSFLRRKREALEPDTATLRTRRTPGLRREEVAERAGVSVDWYVRLEQNRATSASSAVLDRIARALALTRDERVYLFRVSGRLDQAQTAPSEAAGDSARAALRHLTSTPACVLGPHLDVVEANPLYMTLFLGLGRDRRFGRNMVWFVCCDERAPSLLVDHRRAVAEATGALRAAFARSLDAARGLELIAELSRRSPAFVARWAEQLVNERSTGRKSFAHPAWGSLDFDYHSFLSPAAPDHRLVVYDPRDAATRRRLARHGDGR